MKRTILAITLAFSALFGFTACEKESNNKEVIEGLPVSSIKLKMSAPSDDNIVVTRASSEVETSVQNMALLFYKAGSNDKPIVIYVDKNGMGTPTKITTGTSTESTNYQYTVNLDVEGKGITTGNWYLYAIANYDKSFCKVDMSKIAELTRTELLNYCVLKADREIDIVENGILMTGNYCESGTFGDDGSLTLEYDNKEEESCLLNGVIHLRRIVAKVTFKFKSGKESVTFTPETYSIHEYSRSSTLMERAQWTNGTDGVTSALGYMGSKEGEAFHSHSEGENLAVSNNTIEFYMPENVQKAESSPESGWAYNSREKRRDRDYSTFEYAPQHGTYIVVKGQYKDASYSGDVTYTIHLGDFSKGGDSYGNFTTRRNYHYTYNITVNGVNKIVAEAEQKDLSEEGGYQHGAEGNIIGYNSESFNIRLDAHYENVLLKIKIPETGALDSYAVMLNTPYSNNEIVEMNDVAGGKDISNIDYNWIRFDKPESTTRFKSVTDGTSITSRTVDIFGLLEEIRAAGTLANGNYDHYIVSGGYIYTAAYVNEYYYEDKIATASNTSEELKKFINADDRSITIAFKGINVSEDKHSTFTGNVVFSIQQRSIKTFFNIGVDNPYGVEQVEETASTTTFGTSTGGTERLNGYNNIKSAISNTNWSNYINAATLGYTSTQTEIPSSALTTTGKYAIYQCLSRNRDENGDGVIDDSEIKWYLPAVDQCTAFWFGMNSLPESARIEMQTDKGSQNNYWNSTRSVNVWWADEGSAYGAYQSYSGTPKVRCVRSLKDVSGTVTEVSSYNEDTRVVSISGLDDRSIRTSDITGEYAEHFRGENTDRLPSAFKIASSDLTATLSDNSTKSAFDTTDVKNGEWCQEYYSEETDKSDLGKWRIPNEKELTLMFKHTSLTEKTAARSKYNRPGLKVNMVYYINGTNITTDYQSTSKYNDFVIRCVRDATPDSSGSDETDKGSNTFESGGNVIK